MIKKTIILILLFSLFYCKNNDNMITKNQIGKYILGKKLDNNYDDKIFDIKVNQNNIIISIIYRDKKYKTNEGFGVGTSFDKIKRKAEKSTISNLTISKENTLIGDLGKILIYQNIIFIDNNQDEIVDFIWIEKK